MYARSPALLTAALIVRDEAHLLEACLESVRGVTDQIVVVDTGSVDDSPAIARAYGADVIHHPWTGDFSDARNVALDRAAGEWILYIDADERLDPVERLAVESLLRDADEIAFRPLFRPRPQATPYREYRLWRNDPRIRFQGVIHETVVPAIHAVAEADGRPIGRCDLQLVHYGYEGDQTHKHHRNLPLLRRQLEREPGHLFAWHHLARVLEGLGQPDEAEHTLAQAVDIARAQPCVDPVAVLVYADLVRMRRQRGEDAATLLAEARRLFPDNCLLLWLESRMLIDRGAYVRAIGVIDRILSVDQSLLPDLGPSYDEQLFGELPHDARGLCLFRLGRYSEAAAEYAAAARCAPDDPSYPAKVALATARATANDRPEERERAPTIATSM